MADETPAFDITQFPSFPPEVQRLILEGSAATVPPGITPNFIDPPNNNILAIVILSVCFFIATICALGRAWTRLVIAKQFGLEDFLGLLCYGCYVVLGWVNIEFLIKPGFYVHQYNVQFQDMVEISQLLSFGLGVSYISSLLFGKPAVLLGLIRIFAPHGTNKTFARASYILIALNTILYLSSIVGTATLCIPHEAIWYPWVKGTCIDRNALAIVGSAFNIVIDLIILVLPQPIIWKLQMTTQRRLGVSLVFSVGVLVAVCAAGRLYATSVINYYGDSTYPISDVLLWGWAEITCVIVVFCMPALPKTFGENGFLNRIVQSFRWGSKGTKTEASSWTAGTRKTVSSHMYGMMDEDPANSVSSAELGMMRFKDGFGQSDTNHSHKRSNDGPAAPVNPNRPKHRMIQAPEKLVKPRPTFDTSITKTTEFETREDPAPDVWPLSNSPPVDSKGRPWQG